MVRFPAPLPPAADPPRRPVRTAVRAVCAVYWAGLSVLLLLPDPGALLGLVRTGVHVPQRGTHFTFFAVLGLLAMASRPRRMPFAVAVGLLMAYAVVIESLQIFVPPRTVELLDYVENIAGLATGAAAWCALGRLRRREAPP